MFTNFYDYIFLSIVITFVVLIVVLQVIYLAVRLFLQDAESENSEYARPSGKE